MLSKYVLLLILISTNVLADGLLRTADLKRYCDQDGINRQTIIYLDQSVIAKKDPNWYKDILNKTKFLPGERLQVVTINDGGSTVELVWDSCYPSYTSKKYAKLKSEDSVTSIFTGGVEDQLKSDSKVFETRLMQALAHPLAKSRHEQAPSYKDQFPIKKLVEAFYYDASRMGLKSGIPRVIVFSDMIEKSDLVAHDNFEPIENADQVAKRFPTFLNHSSFYIYGINYTNSETILNEKMEKFWRRYLLKSGAEIAHYGTQLVLPRENTLIAANSYKGKLTQSDGKNLATSLRVAYLPNGDLIHSWISIGDHYLVLQGNISCSGQNCELRAQIKESVFDGFKVNDVLTLDGTIKNLKGTIGARDDSVIDAEGKIYRFNVEYTQDSTLSM